VLAKGALGGGATEWAQGGIAAVLEAGDSFDGGAGHDEGGQDGDSPHRG